MATPVMVISTTKVMKFGMISRKCIKLILLALLPICGAKAQVAGLSTLSVLDMSSTSRTAGLGLDYLPLYGNDISIAIDNPSLLSTEMHNALSLNYVNLFAGANFGSIAYAQKSKHLGTLLYGFHFNSFGRFDGYDENENYQGHFHAADYVATVGWGFAVDSNFSVGAMLKPVLSQYERYTALAIAIDVASSYVSYSRRFTATLMARNVGAQILTFDGSTERLPFELSAAMSYKLQDAPFRIYLAATELQRWNLRYADPLNPTSITDPFTGEVMNESAVKGFFDNLARHLIAGVELSIGKAFTARVGYNYRQSRETYGTTNFNTSGFSLGFNIKVKGFEFGYARNNYNLSQAPNYITLTTSLERIFGK